MVSDPNFADGLGLDIHLRTKLVRHWSYIKNVAIRIENDILEVQGGDDFLVNPRYWINSEFQAHLTSPTPTATAKTTTTIGGFPVTLSPSHKVYTIDLSEKYPGQSIQINIYKEFVGVRVVNATARAFGETVGMSGDFVTGNTYGRDGVTVLHDFAELGNEWQVLPSEPKLFREMEHPQFPEKCIMPEDPRGERRRRLDESSISIEEAEKACGGLEDGLSRKDCVYDVLATQDLGMVGAF